jgi:phage terminase large subunit-like protein
MAGIRSPEPSAETLGISAEVFWYLRDRGFGLPTCPPMIATPEPSDAPGARFDPARVDRVVAVCRALRHVAGPLAGEPLEPDPWQVAYILAPIFGWVRQDSHGRYIRIIREAWVEVSRKNGKTSLAGAIAIYLTAADQEAGAQVIAAATTKDQAGYCFRPIKQLVEQSPLLKRHLRAYAAKIVHRRNGSSFQAIASVADAQHGANIAGAIVDEVHLFHDAELIEAIETGTGSRSQPLVFMITTADTGAPMTVYERKRRRIEQLAAGALQDPTTYGVIWAAARSERELSELHIDPFSAATQRRANPGYGISPTAEYLERAAQKAKENPAELGTYLRLHLGVRTRQVTRYIGLHDWDASAGLIDETALRGRMCFGGLDLSSVDDISALCWLFPDRDADRYDAVWRFWLPEARLAVMSRRTAGGAEAWARQGILTLTSGNVIDNDAIVDRIDADAAQFDVQTLGYDRWGATDVVRRLGESGMTCVGVGQGYATLSAPSKELLRLVLRQSFTHGGNPVARWMLDNLTMTTDPGGQVKPDKARAADKIDGISAAITAMSEAMAAMDGVDILDAVY